ncbi:MAG: outer membrane protein assembly factor BamD [Myxococcales bacterium]|nr:outer membrane protein assembly factor BamD [Myxococcales bacterium]
MRRSRRAALPAFAVLALLPVLPGCFWFTSAAQGEALRRDVDSLRIDVDIMRESLDVERARFRDMVNEARQQVEELERVLQRTTDLLTRNSADFGAEFEDLKDEVARLRGRMDEVLAALREVGAASATHTRRLDRLERAAGLDPEINADEAPATADELWARAGELVTQESYGVARAYYRLFQSRYPDDPRKGQADAEIGAAYAMEGRFGDAIAVLSAVARANPDAPYSDRVYYYTGLSLVGLGRCDEAKTLLRTMVRKFPQSPLKAPAEQLLAQLRTDSRCR